ncbi:MAG: serine hydroxymethyltransferase, partial [Microgenomates group bacterium]
KARQPEFKVYANQTVKNAKVLAEELTAGGFDLVTGGTDNHLMVVDLRKVETEGKSAAVELEKSGIVVNANTIPNDPNPAYKPSGIRLGTPAVTARGMKEEEMEKIGQWIKMVIVEKKNVLGEVKKLCEEFPVNI